MSLLVSLFVANEFGAGMAIASFVVLFGVPMVVPMVMNRPIGSMKGMAFMAISKEIWQDHIEGNLFKNNEFLLASTDAGQYVIQGKIVHIPQAGSVPGTQENRTDLPASVTTRTDTDVTYELKAYTTDPILIPNAETYELSYNKRQNVLEEHQATLNERIADGLLIKWATVTAGNILRTTGASVATHLAGTTGTRKKVLVNDLKAAQLKLNKQKIARADRFALFSSDMMSQLMDDMTATQYRDFSAAMDVKNGVVGMLFGFKIMERSDTVIYNVGATAVNAYGVAGAVTDNDAVLCWQRGAIERAVGNVTAFEKMGDPTYYGDLYSFEVRMGGRIRRSDERGIVAIVQTA